MAPSATAAWRTRRAGGVATSSAPASKTLTGITGGNAYTCAADATGVASTKCCLCGCCEGGRDAEVMEEGMHADAEGLVVAVHASPDGGFAPHAGAADSGEDRADDLVTEGKQRGDGAGGLRGDAVAP